MSDWPLSLDELQQLVKPLAAKMSFVTIATPYCKKIESIASSTFTHRCVCPSPFHKNGVERTPSFYFSDTNKFYKCFGCGISGNIFEFLTLTEGIPWYQIVVDLLNNEQIDVAALQSDTAVSPIDVANLLFELNMDISAHMRAYMASVKSTDVFVNECKWADALYKRIDETFLKLIDGDLEQARSFHSQILIEISRRELLHENKIRDCK